MCLIAASPAEPFHPNHVPLLTQTLSVCAVVAIALLAGIMLGIAMTQQTGKSTVRSEKHSRSRLSVGTPTNLDKAGRCGVRKVLAAVVQNMRRAGSKRDSLRSSLR
jgi:hypothetical protein